jgi:hypothetical protein
MLESLPTELIQRIACYSSDEGLSSLRLVSRRISSAATWAYATRWLGILQTDLSSTSLSRLQYIANHETFRHFPVRLVINDSTRSESLGCGDHWVRDEFGCVDISSPTTVAFREWLVYGMERCRSFEIVKHSAKGRSDSTAPNKTLSATDVIHLLLLCIAGLPVKAFCVSIRDSRPPDPDKTSLEVIKSKEFQEAWGFHLEDLWLEWCFESDKVVELSVGLVTAASNIQTLALEGGGAEYQNLLSRLAECENLAHLTELRLGEHCAVEGKTLCNFLRHFSSSLTSLSFFDISLSEGSWLDIYRTLRYEFAKLSKLQIDDTVGIYDEVTTDWSIDPHHLEAVLSPHGEVSLETSVGMDNLRVLNHFKFEGPGMRIALETLEAMCPAEQF